jgi:LacI family transcriptional regulator
MTVKEIAELAGVSVGTVDRVLYQRGRVSAVTRARVKEIVERYQFTPNPIARQLKRNRAYRFCALVPRRDQDSSYWEQIISGIEKGADEVGPLGVETEIIEYDRYNFAGACDMVDSVLAKDPDGIILAPIILIKQLLPRIQKRQIPYNFFDSDFPEMKPVCTISQDPIQGGYLAGRLLHLFAGTIIKPVAVLDAHSQDYHIVRRRNGFLQYAREHNFSTVVKEYSDKKELSETEISLFLQEHPDLTGIFVTNSMAHRVAQTVKNLGVERNFRIIGYDLTPYNGRFLKEGLIDAIISQRPEEQGRQALVNLYRHIVLQQKVDPKIEIPLDVYIRENTPDLP